jgi:hypothetical protein
MRTLATVFLLLLAVAFARADGLEQTHQTVPSANSSFLTDLQNFLKREDAARHADLYPSSVVSGGTHATAAGLVGTPAALVAYVGGYYITEDASITYPDASTCWVIAHKTMTANQGSFTRVSGSHYLINCSTTAQPTLPDADSVYLMQVTTSGGAITAVTDLRPFGGEVGFNACRYDSLEDAVIALGARPAHIVLNCALPVQTNTSIPSTASIFPTRSGYFDVASGVTITMASPLQIPSSVRWQVFRGASTAPVSFTNAGTINPEWWGGGIGTSAANNTTYINRAIDSQPTGSMMVFVSFAHGTYEHDNAIETNSRNVCLQGPGRHATTLELTTEASSRHGFKATGTTQYQCVRGLTMITSDPLEVDNQQSAVRMDAENDAVNLTADAVQYVEDFGCIGYNICLYADGGTTFKINERRVLNAYYSIGGSGLTSGVNEGEVCQRVMFCAGHDVYVEGNDVMDHAVYDLTAISSHRRDYFIEGCLNECVKMIPTSNVSGLSDPRHWTFRDSTLRGAGGTSDNAILIAVDQDYIVDRIDLSNNRISNCGYGSSHNACVMIAVSETGIVRNLDLHGFTIDGAQRGAFNFTLSDTAELQFINATGLWVRGWSIETDDTYSVFQTNELGSSILGTLVYSGYFDGNNTGRSIFPPGARDDYDFVQALAVRELNTAVPEGHPLTTRMGTSTATLKLGGNLNCQIFDATEASTNANTTETDLATYTLPAGALDSSVSGAENTSAIHIRAGGFAANTATVKTIRLYFDGTVIESNGVTGSPQNVDWTIDTWIYRLDTNNQTGGTRMDVGTATQGVNVLTLTADLSDAIIIKVTGQNGTANDNDLRLRYFCINGFPN